jgi:uncharacterized membrane protein
MPRLAQRWFWVGRAAGAVIVLGLVGYLVGVGLDRADKIGSAVGAVVALVAVLLPYILPARTTKEPAMPEDEQPSQAVRNAVVGGSLSQLGTVGGNLKVVAAPGSAGPLDDPPPASTAPPENGQRVDGARVGGHVVQTHRVDGDATIG